MIIVTGGAGFIGSHYVLDWLNISNEPIINIDKLTYAGTLSNLKPVMESKNHIFIKEDINNKTVLLELFEKYQPRAIVHFAAESHVDRSIESPAEFIQTNIMGAFTLLEVARVHYEKLTPEKKKSFRFHHVSTDEVYGSLEADAPQFTELTPYQPNSPYAASKASSDHLVRAYYHTYGLPTITTNCSNNYGPFQFKEKLIPLIIHQALLGESLPIYGDGKNIRDWLYVKDHCDALRLVLEKGELGETYNIGGNNEKTNIEVVTTICQLLDELKPKSTPYRDQITYVTDRLGHDRRYAINASKIKNALGWEPKETFETGIRKTVEWYLGQY